MSLSAPGTGWSWRVTSQRQSRLSGERGAFREQVRGGGRAIEVAGKAMLEAVAGRRDPLTKAVHLVIR
jgi:hypothetical protein